jgi:hypothetical protein
VHDLRLSIPRVELAPRAAAREVTDRPPVSETGEFMALWRRKGSYVLTIKITLDSDSFEMSGDVRLVEALPVLTTWYGERKQADQTKIDRLTARAAAANTKLADDVGKATPSS